jgi:hypothetical protein
VFVVAHENEVVGVVALVVAEVTIEAPRGSPSCLLTDDVCGLAKSEFASGKLAFKKVAATHLAPSAGTDPQLQPFSRGNAAAVLSDIQKTSRRDVLNRLACEET